MGYVTSGHVLIILMLGELIITLLINGRVSGDKIDPYHGVLLLKGNRTK